jgi:hypothetical protein
MTNEERRRKLINLLNQARVEQTEYLHNGRAAAVPPFDEYAEKIEKLFAPDPVQTKPLISDFIIGYSQDSGAVYIRHTSELLFRLMPFQKDGDDYFKLTQYGDNEQTVAEMYLCIGEMEGLQELLADMIKQRAHNEIVNGSGS